MSRKIEPIIDPETGEVVAKKHIVKIGPIQYQFTVKSKSALVLVLALVRIAAVCFCFEVISIPVIFFSPEAWGRYLSMPFTVSFVLMYLCAVISIFVLKRIDKEEKNSERED